MHEWLRQTFGLSPATQDHLGATLAVVLILWLVRRIIIGMVWSRTHDARIRYRWQKATAYVAWVLGVVLVARIWVGLFENVGTVVGLAGAGVAIALKDVLTDVAGWAYLFWRRPFKVGDRIQIGANAGDVIDIRLFHFTLNEIGNWVQADQSTGRIIHVPNTRVLTEVVANYSEGFEYIWNEIPVVVTLESDWEKAKKILTDIVTRDSAEIVRAAEESVRASTRKFMIFYHTLTPIVYTSVNDNGIVLTARYLCEPRRRRNTEQTIWEDVLRAFARENDIDLAYRTVRSYNNRIEGKPGTGGPQPPV